jgi:2,4-didehydro-3-deoxy-L-rhamnonate hydrolase
MGMDWLASKSTPTYMPQGPFLVPAAFVDNPQDLLITLKLNGQVMQNESTSDMIFDVARLIEAISAHVQLLPGDLIATGSPAGNGIHHKRLLRPGDVMESTITGLGMQRNPCVAEE